MKLPFSPSPLSRLFFSPFLCPTPCVYLPPSHLPPRLSPPTFSLPLPFYVQFYLPPSPILSLPSLSLCRLTLSSTYLSHPSLSLSPSSLSTPVFLYRFLTPSLSLFPFLIPVSLPSLSLSTSISPVSLPFSFPSPSSVFLSPVSLSLSLSLSFRPFSFSLCFYTAVLNHTDLLLAFRSTKMYSSSIFMYLWATTLRWHLER